MKCVCSPNLLWRLCLNVGLAKGDVRSKERHRGGAMESSSTFEGTKLDSFKVPEKAIVFRIELEPGAY